jgi:hypothetical protein
MTSEDEDCRGLKGRGLLFVTRHSSLVINRSPFGAVAIAIQENADPAMSCPAELGRKRLGFGILGFRGNESALPRPHAQASSSLRMQQAEPFGDTIPLNRQAVLFNRLLS